MKRLFKKGEHVKNVRNGRVMEVLTYVKDNRSYLVECAWFDLDKKEIRTNRFKQNTLLKAS
ncbi:MAG: hypothetical protein MJA30_27220 [Cytophagales bacterium]|nr:hypothetical protein [Cytophagales bacterium]